MGSARFGKSLESVYSPLYYAALLSLNGIASLLLEKGTVVDAHGNIDGTAL